MFEWLSTLAVALLVWMATYHPQISNRIQPIALGAAAHLMRSEQAAYLQDLYRLRLHLAFAFNAEQMETPESRARAMDQ